MIKHVIKVERIEASVLNTICVAADKVKLVGNHIFTNCNIRVPGTFTTTTAKEKGVITTSASLTFHSCETFHPKEIYSFLVTCADGAQYLLGREERPHPVVKVSENFDKSSTNLQQVEVSFAAGGYLPEVV